METSLCRDPVGMSTNISANMTSVSMCTKGNNFTAACVSSPSATVLIFYMVTGVVTLLTVCGNLLVIISVCHFKQLHTPTNILILSLAFSDFLVGLSVMPLNFFWLIEPCWIFGAVMCTLYYFASFQLTCQSVHNVALLALDRYVALHNPFFYLEKVTLNASIIVASLSWVFSIVYNFALLYSNNLFTSSPCLEEGLMLNELWSVVDTVVVFAFPCSMMILLYLRVFLIARRHANEIRKINNVMRPEAKSNHDHKSERKAAKSIGILVFVFLLCLLPYYISSFLSGSNDAKSLAISLQYTSTLFCLNSFFNPIIYALFYPWFQRSLKLIITFRVCSKDSSLSNIM